MEFTREQYDNLPARQIPEFKKFVLERFLDYTKFTSVDAGRGYIEDPRRVAIGPVDSTVDDHGWGGWKVDDGNLFNNEDYFSIYHYMNNERLPTDYYNFVKLPKSFVFGDMERDKDYELYLELKARFE